jgi:hypothetical protein
VAVSTPKDGQDPFHPMIRPAPTTAPPGFAAAPGDADYLTLCAACNAVVRLTDEQAVIAEAELIAFDAVTMACCRRCATNYPARHP